MGKPFNDELSELEQTYRWARATPIESLSARIASMYRHPVYSVGSGGSLTTAEIAAMLFREFGHGSSASVTPLELSFRRGLLRNSSVLLATAGGSNSDILGALRVAVRNEARQVVALCTSLKSRLALETRKFSNVNVEAFDLPCGRDGFLATNSLFASATLLTRAFYETTEVSSPLPTQLPDLVGQRTWQAFVDSVVEQTAPLWTRETLIVLHGPSTRVAAFDLESKLTEAALSNCWIADYRHFGHGRHHWLAKRRQSTSIVAFFSPADEALATNTLREIPLAIPRFVVEVSEKPSAILLSLAYVFPMVLSAGQARSIDPGRPGVPSFGRRIYHINAFPVHQPRPKLHSPLEIVALERKTSRSLCQLSRSGVLGDWQAAYRRVLLRLRAGRYSGIVLDYDGTLCDATERFSGPSDSVVRSLCALLKARTRIGIATGRGQSVRAALRDALPRNHWSRVTIGYYSGAQIATLDDENCPDGTPIAGPELQRVVDALNASKRLAQIASIEPRLQQITVSATSPLETDECWELLAHILFSKCAMQYKLVRSTHSFDILPRNVSKLTVVQLLSSLEQDSAILTIGDMGRWPGNDYELLTHAPSLSVDEVSPDPDTCWNLASPGIRGVDATLEYLSKLNVAADGRLRLRLPHTI